MGSAADRNRTRVPYRRVWFRGDFSLRILHGHSAPLSLCFAVLLYETAFVVAHTEIPCYSSEPGKSGRYRVIAGRVKGNFKFPCARRSVFCGSRRSPAVCSAQAPPGPRATLPFALTRYQSGGEGSYWPFGAVSRKAIRRFV